MEYMNLECLRLLRQEPVPESGTRLDFTILHQNLHLLIRQPKKRQAKRMLTGLVSDGHLEQHKTLAPRQAKDHLGHSGISEGR